MLGALVAAAVIASFPAALDQIVFTRSSGGAGHPPALYVMNSDGSHAHLLARNASAAAVSRDGRTIAFVRGDQIWRMGRDGSNPREVTTPLRHWREALDPTWSPDGRRIYYVRRCDAFDGCTALFSVGAAGGVSRRLTKANCDYGPTVAPNGRAIAFGRILGDCVHGDTGAIRELVLSADKVVSRLPFRFPHRWLYDPAWSRDGRLAYTSSCDAANTPPARGCYGLFVSRADGSAPHRLLWKSADSLSLASPAWSPDGSEIALEGESDTPRIWVVRADGSGFRPLTPGRLMDTEPAWLPARR